MAEYELREGSGNMFKNDGKGNEKAPAYKMDIMLGGTVWEIAGWIKEGKSGKFISCVGKVKGEKFTPKAAPKPAEVDPFDQDIPF